MTDSQSIVDQMTAGLLGSPVYRAERGVGSFLAIDFDEPIDPAQRSPWHLWVYMSDWRIETANEVVVGSRDLASAVDDRIGELDGAVLAGVRVVDDGTVFEFQDGRRLRVVTTARTGDEEWILFMPDDNVLSMLPGGIWRLGPAEGPG